MSSSILLLRQFHPHPRSTSCSLTSSLSRGRPSWLRVAQLRPSGSLFHHQSGPHRVPRGAGPRSPSFRYHRSAQVLLDKFIKHVKYEASLVVKAPFHIKVKGSHFEQDPERAKTASGDLGSSTNPRKNLPSILKQLMQQKEIGETERQVLNRLSDDLRAEYEAQLEDFRQLDPYSEEKVPLHVMLYGRRIHRVDSYSILSSKSQQSHLYVTDASTFEEAQAMFSRLEPGGNKFESCGSISIWQPRHPGASTDHEPVTGISADAEIVAGLKLYIPHHVLDTFDNGLKGVFLVPTLMDRIYLQSKNEGSIELDGHIINELTSVGIYTEAGNIRVKELCSCEVKLASRFGDIISDGTLEGHVVVETYGQGDFQAKYIEGPSLTVTTENGDINVTGEIHTNASQFFTQSGDITLKQLHNSSCIMIRESGNLTMHLVHGEVTAIVKKGDIHATVDSVTGSSSLQAAEGDLTLTIPEKHSFRICATATTTNIAPKILNSGELFLSEKSTHQKFTSGSIMGGKDEDIPMLTVYVPNGALNILMTPNEEHHEELDSIS